MQLIHKNEEANKVYIFGIDHLEGVYLNIYMNNELIHTFTEFFPFQNRLTIDNIEAAINNGIIDGKDIQKICDCAFLENSSYSVFLEGFVLVNDCVDLENAVSTQVVEEQIHQGCRPFSITTFGDYLDLLRNIKCDFTFNNAYWLNNKTGEQEFVFRNDIAFLYAK